LRQIDTADWKKVGSISNAEMYEIAPDILGIVPHPNCTDTQATARQSLAFQDAHWRSRGQRGAAVVFMDPIIDQDSGARSVYANETGESLSTCYALVGETFFGFAVSAVFTGLSKPGIPTQVFRCLQDALPFITKMNRERGGAR
jgi:hypothetical protein